MRKRERFAEFILKLIGNRSLKIQDERFYYPKPTGLTDQDVADIVQRIRQETPYVNAYEVQSPVNEMLEIQLV